MIFNLIEFNVSVNFEPHNCCQELLILCAQPRGLLELLG